MAGPWDVVSTEQPQRPPQPAQRSTPAATALGGMTEKRPAAPARAPQAAATAGALAQPAAGAGEWDVVGTAPMPPEARDVGFVEGAARTAASSAIPVVRSLGLAEGGLLGAVAEVADLADSIAPLFGLKSDLGARVRERQAATFQRTDDLTGSMRQMYQPQPGEEFGLGGQIVGGLASMPIEVAGGFGVQRGVERAGDVVQRGGTLTEAGVAGGVSGAANVAANLLPVKAGGRVGQAIEGALGRVLPGGARAGAVAGGAATGGALGAGAEMGVAAAENAALPEGDQFADLQREAEPGVSGGLGAALGAVAAAASRGKAPSVPKGTKPAQKESGNADVKMRPVSGFYTPEAISKFAKDRLAALESKGKDAPDETVTTPDGKKVTVKGRRAEFVTPDDRAELEFLRKNIGDVEKLADGYGLGVEPAAKPGSEAPPGSVGAAATDTETLRRERAASLPVPIELTKGQASRDFEQLQFEKETAKDGSTGKPLRDFAAEQNARVQANLDALVELTGAEMPDVRGAGKRVVDAVAKRAAEVKGKVDAEYQKAREAGEMAEEVDTTALVTKLRDIEPSAANAGVISTAERELLRLGGATRGEDGRLVPGKLSLDRLEELRKTVGVGGRKDATNAHFASEIRQAIDMTTEDAGGDIYRRARAMYRDYAAEFKNRRIVADLISTRRGSDERKVALEDVVKKTVHDGSVEELAKLRDTLRGAGLDGQQAWRELQGQTLAEIRDATFRTTARNERGDPVASVAGMDRAIKALDRDGKLELMFGKKGAETIRDLRDLTSDIYTAPPGAVNFSNTASALRNMFDQLATYGLTGLPVPAREMMSQIGRMIRSRGLRKKVLQALPKPGEKVVGKPMGERPFEPPPPVPPAPKPETPPRPIPAGRAREMPPEPPATGRAPDLPRLPTPEVIEDMAPRIPVGEARELGPDSMPGTGRKPPESGGGGAGGAPVAPRPLLPPKPPKPLPAGEARELDDAEFAAWQREENLGGLDAAEAVRVARALRVDAEAVERAAVQHARQPGSFARAIDRILEKETTDASATPEAAGRGQELPGQGRRETGNRQGEGAEAAAAAEETGQVTDEPSGAAPPKPGQPFLVARVGSSGALDNRNAGNADAVAAFLGRLDDFERPQPAGAERSDTITVYRAVVDGPFGMYQRAARGAIEGGGTAVGRMPEKFGTSYSFPAGGAWRAEPVGKVSVADLRADLKAKHGTDSFDDAGGAAVAELLRERMQRMLAAPTDASAAETARLNRTSAETEIAAAMREFEKATAPTGNPITDKLGDKLRTDYSRAVEEYASLPDTKGGTVLNTDTARELSADYLADRTRSADVHEPASAFIKRLYAEKLAGPTPPGMERRVLFTAGGTGAGKTTAVNAMPDAMGRPEITYDTNMNTAGSAIKKIEQALEAGREVRIAYVYADPEQAFQQAMDRANSQKAKFGSGRTVPIVEHVATHVGVSKVIRDLVDRYRHDLRVNFQVIDNSRGRGNAALVELRDLPVVGDNGLRERLEAAAQEAHRAGRIDAATLAGFLGESRPAPERAGLGQAVRGRPEQGDRGQAREVAPPPAPPQLPGPVGQSTSVVTERGMRVPVRYRLVEASDLVTSHRDDLSINPDFPSEFQPRDRTRASSEEQIARIANAIQPELLADSPKASDGAPIVSPGGLVESGNARTIALRRAYGAGKADGYKAWLADNAERFGLSADQVRAAQRPVLVRERTVDVDVAEFARQANEAAVSSMSDAEQARADAGNLPDLEGLVTNDDGTINLTRSVDFIRDFMRTVASPSDRGRLMTAEGRLSQTGMNRIRNAVFSRAYDDPDLVARMAEATDGNTRNVMAGLLRAAPQVARLRELSGAGARGDVSFVDDVVEAVRRFSDARENGQRVDDYLAQGSLIGGDASPRVAEYMRQLEIDSRAPRRIAEWLERLVSTVDSAGDPRQASLLPPAENLADDLQTQQRFLEARAKAAGFDDIDAWAAADIDGFIRAAAAWRERNPATTLSGAAGATAAAGLAAAASEDDDERT